MENTDFLRINLIKYSMSIFGRSVFIKSRLIENVYHRQSVMYILYNMSNDGEKIKKYTLNKIGYICGDGHFFNHATVIHSCKIVERELPLYTHRKASVEMWTTIIYKVLQLQDNDLKSMLDLLDRLDAMMVNDVERMLLKKIKMKVIL